MWHLLKTQTWSDTRDFPRGERHSAKLFFSLSSYTFPRLSSPLGVRACVFVYVHVHVSLHVHQTVAECEVSTANRCERGETKGESCRVCSFRHKVNKQKKKKKWCVFFFSKHIDTKYRDTPYALHIEHTHFSTVAALWSCRHFLKCLLDWTKAELWERIEQLVEFWRWRDFCEINGSCRRLFNGLLLKKKKMLR